MYLMLKDKPVLKINSNVTEFKIIDSSLLPYSLFTLVKNNDTKLLRDWISNRFIYINFQNYKAVVNSVKDINLQDSTRLSIAKQYHAVSVNDCYWLKFNGESFSDVAIWNNKIIDIVCDTALLGLLSTLTLKDLSANVDIKGRFPKTWKRFDDGLYLLKSDTQQGEYVVAELQAQSILDATSISNCHYELSNYKGYACTSTKCFTDENVMFVAMKDIQPFFEKKGFDYKKSFKKQLAEMAYIDYVTGNTDRHLGNYGFLVNANSNGLFGFAPLFDFNISMNITAKNLNTRLRTELYYPTNKSILESAVDAMYILGGSVPLEFDNAPDYVNERLKILKENVKSKYISMYRSPYEEKINAFAKQSGKSKDEFIKYYSSVVTDNVMRRYPQIENTTLGRTYVGYCILEGIDPTKEDVNEN